MSSPTRDALILQSQALKNIANNFVEGYDALEEEIIQAKYADEAGGGGGGGGGTTLMHGVEQFGVKWKFVQGPFPVGQYANGDYYVVSPTGVLVGRDDVRTLRAGMDGSMLNPTAGNIDQGYDSAMRQTNYNSDLNVIQTPSKFVRVLPGESLVSSISHEDPGNRPQLKTAAVLNVVAIAPPTGTFRPPYVKHAAVDDLNTNMTDIGLLPTLKAQPGMPAIEQIERYFERPWIDHIPNWMGRECHPIENMQDYGRNLATEVGIGALALLTGGASNELLLYRYLQLGIDLYGIATNGGGNNWQANGGHASGRKWPILFARLMFGMVGDNGRSRWDLSGIAFGEDQQTFIVKMSDVGRTLKPDKRDVDAGRVRQYNTSDLGKADWGITHAKQPEQDNAHFDSIYRKCCTANSWVGSALAAMVMGMEVEWNHPAFFNYMDRYLTSIAIHDEAWMQSWHPWPLAMWREHR
ncbi:MAG TPA: hypothetical protein VM537_01555 [Anaerolineae bacterium]|nr:hypothetical protein [Anaerolineae bacterium]